MIRTWTRVSKDCVITHPSGEVDALVTFLSPSEAREYCGKAGHTLNQWREYGWLKSVGKVGRAHVYTKKDLDTALSLLGHNRKNLNVEVKDGK